MASIPTLFNLDPTQFALGRSTGKLRNLVGAPTTQNPAELGNLLQGIAGITATEPTEADVPKTTPGVDAYQALSEEMKALLNLDAGSAYADLVSALRARNSIPAANYRTGIISGMVDPYIWSDEASLKAGNYTPSQQESDAYRRYVLAERLDRRVQTWRPELEAYQKAATDYKTKAETYAADINRYIGEQETARNKFQSEYLGQDVEDPNILASGDVLAASSLYSDQLHQQMIERIAEANADVMPGSDQVTSLYS